MIVEHKKLLETIEAAQDQAEALKAKGEGVDGIMRDLRSAGRQTASRISYYEAAAKENKAPRPGSAPPPVPSTGSDYKKPEPQK